MATEIKKIQIMGNTWVIYEDDLNNPMLASCDGFTLTHQRTIMLREKEYMDESGSNEDVYNHILRHELVHAIAFECGLDRHLGHDEMLVDWIAHISPILESLVDGVLK